MGFRLSNDNITVELTSLGGTLSSIKDGDGLEYLWQGDAKYWSGQAPILFPICGSLRDDQAFIGGNKTTKMPRHGLVRKREFQLVEETKDRIVFSICSDPDMETQFPYSFQLYAQYELKEKGVLVTYKVKNTNDCRLPFFIGGHPGFNCPLVKTENYADYAVEFEHPENIQVPTPVTETGLIDVEHRQPFMSNETSIPLRHELFEKDAVILDELKSRKLNYVSKKSGKGIQLEYKDFPYLILWSSSNGGDFVAIEPWVGLSTCSDEGNVFEEKRNVQIMEAGEMKTYSFEISIL